MKLSTRARYGARALVELAWAYPDDTLSVKHIAQRQRISPKYLEQIFAALKATGLIRAARGMHGGYELARSPSSISLSEVFSVLEGSPALVDCVEYPQGCSMKHVCPTHDTWVELRDAVEAVLKRTTLEDLVERQKQKDTTTSYMYHI